MGLLTLTLTRMSTPIQSPTVTLRLPVTSIADLAKASFHGPSDIVFNQAGDKIFLADYDNHAIRPDPNPHSDLVTCHHAVLMAMQCRLYDGLRLNAPLALARHCCMPSLSLLSVNLTLTLIPVLLFPTPTPTPTNYVSWLRLNTYP